MSKLSYTNKFLELKYALCAILIFACHFLNSQNADKVNLLVGKNYITTKIVCGKNQKKLEDNLKIAERDNRPTGKFLMRFFISSKDNDGFKKGDTLVEYDWDIQNGMFSYTCVSKYKINLKDSLLVFHNIKYKLDFPPNNEKRFKRTFKILKFNENLLVLKDLDFNNENIRMEYHFKKKGSVSKSN